MAGVGLVGLLSKLHKWDESAMYFDGSSLGKLGRTYYLIAQADLNVLIALFVFAIAIYLTVTITALQAVAGVLTPEEANPEGLFEDRVQALRVLSAGNIIIILCLAGILVLQVRFFTIFSSRLLTSCVQAGQEYARRAEVKALAAAAELEKKATVPTEKKVQ
jgi:hypothetical protein